MRGDNQSQAAMRSKVLTAITKAHRLSESQVAVFPSAPRSQETIEPMMPGRAAAALPAKLARAHPRACRCFLTHSFKPLLSEDGLGAVWVYLDIFKFDFKQMKILIDMSAI